LCPFDDDGIDFVEDLKCACAREGVPFDNDIFNELVTQDVPTGDRASIAGRLFW